jgi:hypothetical protein
MNTQIFIDINPALKNKIYIKINKYAKNFIKKYGKYFKQPFINRQLYIKINPSTFYDTQRSNVKCVLDYDVKNKKDENAKNFYKFMQNKLSDFYIYVYDSIENPYLSYLYLDDKENFITESQENFNKIVLTIFCFLNDQDKFIIPPNFI